MKVMYQANDGKLFSDCSSCKQYESTQKGYFVVNNRGLVCDITDDDMIAIVVLTNSGVTNIQEDLKALSCPMSFDFTYPGVFLYSDYMADFIPFDSDMQNALYGVNTGCLALNVDIAKL